MNTDQRLRNEIVHGKYILSKGEQVWNWSSPAGRLRWDRRCSLFRQALGEGGKRVLEVGCGTGLFTLEIAKTANEITAIDISADLLAEAKKRVTGRNVNFLVENAYSTSFADGTFDSVVGSSILHHLDVKKALKEFFRILKPSGKVLFTEPNMLNPQIAIQKNVPFIKKMAGDSPDESAFIRWVLAADLRQAGFNRIRVTPFDFLHPAIPSRALFLTVRPLLFLEKVPLLKEISGSLIIQAEK